jgi:hypothetical protein
MMQRMMILAVLSLSLAAPARASDEPVEFKTVSGNILCSSYLDPNDNRPKLRCDIIKYRPAKPVLPMPADCDGGWGNMFIVNDTGKSGLECAGDLAANPESAGILEYGQEMERYGITCAAEKSGLTCTNKDGHGFFLSRNKQKLF